MRKIHYYNYLIKLLVLFLFISCDRGKNIKNEEVTVIDFTKCLEDKRKILLSDIAAKVEYIQLETLQDCLIKKITQIRVIDSLVIVQNEYDNLLVFDNTGSFKYRVGEKGKGPGEYIQISDFEINVENRTVLVLDNSQKKIVEYSLKGEFLNEEHLNYFFNEFEINSNNISLLNYNINDEVIIQTKGKNGRTFGKDELEIPTVVRDIAKMNSFYCVKDSLSYWNYITNQIIRIKNMDVVKRYVFNFGKDAIPTSEIGRKPPHLYTNRAYVDSYIETDNYFLIQIVYKNRIKRFFYNKDLRTLLNVNNGKFRKAKFNIAIFNDVDYTCSFWPDRNGRIAPNILYKTFFASDLKKLSTKSKFELSESDRFMFELIDKSTVLDNPVIMKVTLK